MISKKRIYFFFIIIIAAGTIELLLEYNKIIQSEKAEELLIKQTIQNFDITENNPQELNGTFQRKNILEPEYHTGNECNSTNKTDPNNDVDCIISIPDIDLLKNVYTGSKRNTYLEQYNLITATDDMEFANGGNYIICGHSSRLYGHSLNRIKEIKKKALIYILYNNKKYTYSVKRIYFDHKDNINTYFNQTENPQITIVSCAKYFSEDGYIIIQAEPY